MAVVLHLLGICQKCKFLDLSLILWNWKLGMHISCLYQRIPYCWWYKVTFATCGLAFSPLLAFVSFSSLYFIPESIWSGKSVSVCEQNVYFTEKKNLSVAPWCDVAAAKTKTFALKVVNRISKVKDTPLTMFGLFCVLSVLWLTRSGIGEGTVLDVSRKDAIGQNLFLELRPDLERKALSICLQKATALESLLDWF